MPFFYTQSTMVTSARTFLGKAGKNMSEQESTRLPFFWLNSIGRRIKRSVRKFSGIINCFGNSEAEQNETAEARDGHTGNMVERNPPLTVGRSLTRKLSDICMNPEHPLRESQTYDEVQHLERSEQSQTFFYSLKGMDAARFDFHVVIFTHLDAFNWLNAFQTLRIGINDKDFSKIHHVEVEELAWTRICNFLRSIVESEMGFASLPWQSLLAANVKILLVLKLTDVSPSLIFKSEIGASKTCEIDTTRALAHFESVIQRENSDNEERGGDHSEKEKKSQTSGIYESDDESIETCELDATRAMVNFTSLVERENSTHEKTNDLVKKENKGHEKQRKPKKKRRRIKCYNCGKKGHMKKDCWFLK